MQGDTNAFTVEQDIMSDTECADLCYATTDCNLWTRVKDQDNWKVNRCLLRTEVSYRSSSMHNSGLKPVNDPNDYRIKVTPTELQTTTGYTLRASSNIIDPDNTTICNDSYGGVNT